MLCGRRKTFATFSEDALQFSWQARHLDVSILILHVRRNTLDASCCVFLRIALAGLSQVATRCRFRGRCGILWDVLKIDGSLARNIDFEVANLEAPMKLAGKRRFWSYKVWKLRNSRTKGSFWSSHVSRLDSLVFLWRRRVYGEAANLSFSKVSKQVVMSFCMAGMALCDIPTCLITVDNVKIGGSLARNARFAPPTCLVSSLWFSARVSGFPVASPCLWGKLQNLSFSSKVSKQVVMSFCVAGVALCDMSLMFPSFPFLSHTVRTPPFKAARSHAVNHWTRTQASKMLLGKQHNLIIIDKKKAFAKREPKKANHPIPHVSTHSLAPPPCIYFIG